MKCFNHPDRDACAACLDCGKNLCRDYATVFKDCLCLDCAAERHKSAMIWEVKRIMPLFVISLIIAGGTIKFGGNDTAPLRQDLLVALIFSGIPWGWSFISELISASDFPECFQMSILFIFLKLIASCLIGVFAMMWNVIRIVYLFIQQRSNRKLLLNMRKQLSATPARSD